MCDVRFSQFFNKRGQSEVSIAGATFSGFMTIESSSCFLTSAMAPVQSEEFGGTRKKSPAALPMIRRFASVLVVVVALLVLSDNFFRASQARKSSSTKPRLLGESSAELRIFMEGQPPSREWSKQIDKIQPYNFEAPILNLASSICIYSSQSISQASGNGIGPCFWDKSTRRYECFCAATFQINGSQFHSPLTRDPSRSTLESSFACV